MTASAVVAKGQQDPCHHHWLGIVKTCDLASLLADFGKWKTTDEFYSYFVTLPIIKNAWKRGDETD